MRVRSRHGAPVVAGLLVAALLTGCATVALALGRALQLNPSQPEATDLMRSLR